MKSSRKVGRLIQKLEPSPHETHVRSEYLVTGADEVIAIEGLHIDEGVRSIVNAIENNLSAGGVRQLCNSSDIDNGTERMGGNSAGYKTGLRSEERREVFHVKVVVFTHLPPDNLCALRVQVAARWRYWLRGRGR